MTFDTNLIPDLLPIYYKRIFPFSLFYKWLSYGNVSTTYFPHREFSFTLADDIYIRYQSFKDQVELEKAIEDKCPHKIDIGAVYSFRPKDHRTVSVFKPLEKELVFDIDMTDYDEVRTCCEGADICSRCWKFMIVAVKILDAALRGIHCWVCDASARELPQSARSALAEYLQVIRGGDDKIKKVSLGPRDIHPSLRRAADIAKEYFVELCLRDQDILGTADRWKKILAMIPDHSLQESLENVMQKCDSSEQRWVTIEAEINRNLTAKGNAKKGIHKNLCLEIILQHIYPRLDINVSKGLSHLLKAPFCVHPKTGRVCVPFDVKSVDNFDPSEVPTISELIEEISKFDSESSEIRKTVADYKKTSMRTSTQVFENFLFGLGKENATRRQEKNG